MFSEKLCQQFEGQLCKYTNVMKGWQFRWFVLDPEIGVLEYFLNESERKQRPRGSVHLAAAVISPSDEDSNTFTVNSATGDMFKLRAADARARHEWVSRIRSVAEMHTMAIAQSNPPLPPREHHVAPHGAASVSGPCTRVHCTLAVLDAFSAARDYIHRAEQSSYSLSRAVEDLPGSGPFIRNIDEAMLLLKATSQATIYCLSHCLSMLQQQQIAHAYTPSTFHSTSSAPSSGGTFPTRKATTVPPVQYNDYETKKSSQHEFSAVWSEPMPVTSRMSLLTGSNNPARVSPKDDVTDEEDLSETSLVLVEDQKSVILHLLSQLKLGMDLTQVVLPTFILEKRSLLEMFADCMGHPQLFVCIPDELTPFGRIMALLEWYLTSFHVGHTGCAAKKPYNPIIGETFHCSWKVQNASPFMGRKDLNVKCTLESANLGLQSGSSPVTENVAAGTGVNSASDGFISGQNPVLANDLETGRYPTDAIAQGKPGEIYNVASKSTNASHILKEVAEDAAEKRSSVTDLTDAVIELAYVAEQVSHHPPVTAFYVECPVKNMCLNGSIWTKSNYSGMSLGVNMIGELNLYLGDHGERYDISLPSAFARSVISVPWFELGGKTGISCPVTGYSASIIFHTKSFYGGKVHLVTAEVKSPAGTVECRVQGEWNSHYEFTYANGETKVIKVLELPAYKKRVRKVSEQAGNESRRLWNNVTQALKMGDIDAATKYKQTLEERQRHEHRMRNESGVPYTAEYFKKTGDSWVFNNLLCEL